MIIELGERVADVSFHRVRRKMQLLRDGGVGRPARDKTYDLQLGVGEAAPSDLVSRLPGYSSFHTKPSQRAGHATGIRERFVISLTFRRHNQLLWWLLPTTRERFNVVDAACQKRLLMAVIGETHSRGATRCERVSRRCRCHHQPWVP
jgi:hypothetical protein